MVYVDTSIAVALFVPEARTAEVKAWFAANAAPLVAADWIVTEFASALSIKERRGDLAREDADAVWRAFTDLCGAGLRLVPVTRAAFAAAASSSVTWAVACGRATRFTWRSHGRSARIDRHGGRHPRCERRGERARDGGSLKRECRRRAWLARTSTTLRRQMTRGTTRSEDFPEDGAPQIQPADSMGPIGRGPRGGWA